MCIYDSGLSTAKVTEEVASGRVSIKKKKL